MVFRGDNVRSLESSQLGILRWNTRFRIWFICCVASLWLQPSAIWAQAEIDDTEPPKPGTDSFNVLPLNVGPQMFFDAQSTQFTRDGDQQVFQGDVVAVGAGVLITADKISMDRRKMRMVADGHVIILTENQVYMGDRIKYNIKTGDFLLTNSVMIANDEKTVQDVSRRVLGFTPAEVAFDEQKAERLKVIEQRKSLLRDQFLDEVQSGELEPSPDLLDKYSILLEQQDLMQNQENPFFAKMAKERRRRFKARRFHWEKGIEESRKLRGKSQVTSYFRIDGKELSRENLNDYKADEAFWTPCKCEDDDEVPSWGFRASEIEAQMEGYVDFYHPVLEIKGIPVLYLPYMKIPLKEKRQSGFLMPTFSQRSRSGNIFSQPVYFAVAEDFDSTLTADIHEKRGTKLGVEARYQQKRYSGWRLNLAGMRDRVWMEDIKNRRAANDFYFNNDEGNIVAFCENQVGNDPNLIAQCIRSARNQLAVPENEWRGEMRWQGVSILAPRLSFVSRGDLYSDHRYIEELTLLQDFQSALDAATRATYFSTSKYNLNLNAKNFYAGVGGRFGDNVLTTERFEGQQVPYQFVLQSRFYSIDRGLLPVPLYVQAKGEHFEISDFVGQTDDVPQLDGENRTLGSGFWQRLKFDQVSPIVSESIIKVDQFSDYEIRGIGHDRLEDPRSSIWSYRGGLTLNLPIDGDAKLPAIFQSDETTAFGSNYVRHYMNWALTFSVRPEVHRTGPYGEYNGYYYRKGEYREGPQLVYFAGDRTQYINRDNDIPESETMDTHKSVTFQTSHTWDVFRRGWKKTVGLLPNSTKKTEQELTYKEKARRELLLSMDRPIKGYEDMFNLEDSEWYVNRYKLIEQNRRRVVSLDASIDYDFEDAQRREDQKKQVRDGEIEDRGQLSLEQPLG